MKTVLFYHSLASDWNHGNAHFLRGTVKELIGRGHDVKVYEPYNGWSLSNLMADHGAGKAEEFLAYYPSLNVHFYDAQKPDYAAILEGADLVIVHEWNAHSLVAEIGKLKERFGYKLLFHDTHHRAVSDTDSMDAYDFAHYDGALVFGDVLKNIYLEQNWLKNVWTWHEAADTTLFKPFPDTEKQGDLIWIGNWGDNERTQELMEFLIRPVQELGLKAKVYGVRYPEEALEALAQAGIEYGGWLPNYKVPEVFAKYKLTVHVPRGPYVKWLPGIPTIRPFEAMACGIPMICSPWEDAEHLFSPGKDYLVAGTGDEMKKQMQRLLNDPDLAQQLVASGLNTIKQKHTCIHRVDELENILQQLKMDDTVIYPVHAKILNV